MSTISILLSLLVLFQLVVGQDSCVSLSTSQTCSAFSQFYIGLPGLAKDYPFLLNTTTIADFDAKLLAYVNSTSLYLFPLGCMSSNYNPTIPYARYSLTRLCAAFIQNPSYSLPCNFNNGLTPPPLCQRTCYAWYDSVTRITNNPMVCSDSTQRNLTLAYYEEQCDTWEGFNGTIDENCISGIANEPFTCGFGKDDNQMACRYCKMNSQDMCCQNVHDCNTTLSPGAIVGIVIGCILFIALVVIVLFCICRKKKKKKEPLVNPFLNTSSSASTTLTTSQQKQVVPIDTKQEMGTIESPAHNQEFYVVIHPYPPQMPDELELNAGDIVCLALDFDDGWALGFNVTSGLKGAFPLICISPASEECLDQLLSITNDTNTARPLSTTAQSIQSQIETMQRVESHHLDKLSYDYMEAESPTSPTLQTPFFNSLSSTTTTTEHDQTNVK